MKEIRQDINAALKQVMQKHGIDLSIGNISFSAERFTTRLTAKVTVSEKTKEMLRIPMFQVHGFNIGDSFTHKTKTLKIVGYNPRRPKNCVELEDQNGKKFSASINFVKNNIYPS